MTFGQSLAVMVFWSFSILLMVIYIFFLKNAPNIKSIEEMLFVIGTILVAAAYGAILGSAQITQLIDIIESNKSYLRINIFSWVFIALALHFIDPGSPPHISFLNWIILGSVIGLLVGFFQFLELRRNMNYSFYWILANTIAYASVFVLLEALIMFFYSKPYELLGGYVLCFSVPFLGLLMSVITGIALVSIMSLNGLPQQTYEFRT
jgi:hypothetical protein